ncbi:MAG: hypothetical protein ACKPJH_09400 [Dolichospermum sp.]
MVYLITPESAVCSQNSLSLNFLVLLDKELSNEKMLSEYKAQQSFERGFSFLKNRLFLRDSIFMKSSERIYLVSFCSDSKARPSNRLCQFRKSCLNFPV